MKKWLKYSLLAVLLVAFAAAAYGLFMASYAGNTNVVLLNSGGTYTSLQNIIQRPEFKNKVVYVNVWGTTCGPCLQEFQNHTPQLTKRYENAKDVAFLYLCIDRHPLPELRWKERLRRFKPVGYHVLVEAQEEPLLARDIVGQAKEGRYFPYEPYYFILDKQGKKIRALTVHPEEGELRPSAGNLLYSKLDSLREI